MKSLVHYISIIWTFPPPFLYNLLDYVLESSWDTFSLGTLAPFFTTQWICNHKYFRISLYFEPIQALPFTTYLIMDMFDSIFLLPYMENEGK